MLTIILTLLVGSQNTEHLHLQWAVPEAQPRKIDLLSVVSSFPEIYKWDMGGNKIHNIELIMRIMKISLGII